MSKQNTEASLASLSCNSSRAPTEWSAILAFGVLRVDIRKIKQWIVSLEIIIAALLSIFRGIYSATNLEDLTEREITAHLGNGKEIHGKLQSLRLVN